MVGESSRARIPWAVLLVLCSLLALHNAMRIGPITFIEELRGRYGVDYAAAGNVVGAYTLAYGVAQLAGRAPDRPRREPAPDAGRPRPGRARARQCSPSRTAYSVAVLARAS